MVEQAPDQPGAATARHPSGWLSWVLLSLVATGAIALLAVYLPPAGENAGALRDRAGNLDRLGGRPAGRPVRIEQRGEGHRLCDRVRARPGGTGGNGGRIAPLVPAGRRAGAGGRSQADGRITHAAVGQIPRRPEIQENGRRLASHNRHPRHFVCGLSAISRFHARHRVAAAGRIYVDCGNLARKLWPELGCFAVFARADRLEPPEPPAKLEA